MYMLHLTSMLKWNASRATTNTKQNNMVYRLNVFNISMSVPYFLPVHLYNSMFYRRLGGVCRIDSLPFGILLVYGQLFGYVYELRYVCLIKQKSFCEV